MEAQQHLGCARRVHKGFAWYWEECDTRVIIFLGSGLLRAQPEEAWGAASRCQMQAVCISKALHMRDNVTLIEKRQASCS